MTRLSKKNSLYLLTFAVGALILIKGFEWHTVRVAKRGDEEQIRALSEKLLGYNERERIRAIRWLGDIPDPRALPPLLSVIRDPLSPMEKIEAIRSLARIRHPPALDILCELTRDAEPQIRICALDQVAAFDHSSVPSIIAAALDDDEPVVRQNAQRIAKESSKATRSSLAGIFATGLNHPDPSFRIESVHRLIFLHDPKTVKPLINALTGPHTNIHSLVEIALIKIGTASLPDLAEILLNEAPETRCAATYILGRIGDPSAVAPLSRLQDDPNPIVVQAAAKALQRIADIEAIPGILTALATTNSPAPEIMEPLLRVEDVAIRQMESILTAHSENTRHHAVQALMRMHSPEARDRIILALADPSPEIRLLIMDFLMNTGHPRVFDLFVFLLKDPENRVRMHATEYLASLGDIKATSPLCKALFVETDDGVAAKIIETLAQFDTSSSIPTLFRHAAKRIGPDLFGQHLPGYDESVNALIARGSSSAGILTFMLTRAPVQIRVTASHILARISDPRAEKALLQSLEGGDTEAVLAARKFFIARNDTNAIPLLLKGFEKYGNALLADDFLNSGNETLTQAAREWSLQRQKATVRIESESMGVDPANRNARDPE